MALLFLSLAYAAVSQVIHPITSYNQVFIIALSESVDPVTDCAPSMHFVGLAWRPAIVCHEDTDFSTLDYAVCAITGTNEVSTDCLALPLMGVVNVAGLGVVGIRGPVYSP